MDFLRDLFGSFTFGIVRLLVAVGIMAAAYFFIVKPVLHTTEHVSDSVNNSINHSLEESFGPHSQTARALRRANRQVRVQVTHAVHRANHSAGGSPTKLLHCVEAAHGDVDKMQRCTVRFAP
jgi:hypothetical protein